MIKLGARPQAGDMSLSFGFDLAFKLDSNIADAQLFTGKGINTGDFLTFKWYRSDDVALRVALRASKHTSKLMGDILDSSAVAGNTTIYGGDYEAKTLEREFVLVPGIEKHFSSSNVFDVYVGGDLFMGFSKKDSVSNRTWGSLGIQSGDYDNYQAITKSTIVGIGGVIGFNVFIAHLPISIGMEYGMSMKWTGGGKTMVTIESQVDGKAIEGDNTYYTDADNSTSLKFEDGLKKSKFDMDTNQDVQIVLNIYFKQ
ncbi:MAG: hypothetical protein JKX73_01095 [Flavobacteriales bacterium]|nr:hypothetical protein [Flavobacteriales bacterium]